MKTTITLAFFCFCSLAGFAQSQSEDNPHTLSVQAGYGWFGFFNNTTADITLNNDGQGNELNYTAVFNGTPAATLAYDYRFGKTFSLGGAIGLQSLDMSNFRNTSTNELVNGQVDINRIFLSARTLFHYGNNPKWDLYSGIRVGVTVWNVNSTLERDEFTFGNGFDISGGSFILPHLVPIPFGVKHYPNERLMVGAELAVGSPHVLALQLGVRL